MKVLWPILVLFLVGCCKPGSSVELTLVQLNDVYELEPMATDSGTEGGLARVAGLLREEEGKNPHTLLLLAGDLLSPSALGHARVDDGKLAGRQMVDVFNKVGLDYMAFGNHEFDLKKDELLRCIDASEFTWLGGNVSLSDGTPWPKQVVQRKILTIPEGASDDKSVTLGIFSLTLDSNPQPWVSYRANYNAVAAEEVRALKEAGCEVIVALTHLPKEADLDLAQAVEGIDLVLGGHEHEHMKFLVGEREVPMTKADANARSAYIHRLHYDLVENKLTLTSKLRVLDDTVPEDAEVKTAVAEWVAKAYAAFKKDGIEPEAEVAVAGADLDGRSAVVRNAPTELTRILVGGMHRGEGVEAAVFNAGSIRIDDVIAAGSKLTEYDVLRILPFGGKVVTVDMKGALLVKMLQQGVANKGKGGFLLHDGIEQRDGAWWINGNAVKDGGTYRITLTDFLLTGLEDNLGFLKVLEKDGDTLKILDNPDLKVRGTEADWPDQRRTLIDALKRTYPAGGK